MNQSGNLVRKRQLYRTTLRFRKWSRKAYAAFASLGRCVTIGCLPKSVADSSLSKQKSGTSAGCKSSRQSLEDTDNGKGQETDIGIPLGSENGLGTKLEIFGFRGLMPVLCPATIGPKGKKYVNLPYLRTKQGLDINTIINKSGTHVTRIMQMLFSDLHDSRRMYLEVKEVAPKNLFSGVSALPPLIPNEMITPMNLLKLVRI